MTFDRFDIPCYFKKTYPVKNDSDADNTTGVCHIVRRLADTVTWIYFLMDRSECYSRSLGGIKAGVIWCCCFFFCHCPTQVVMSRTMQ